ncbi:MAG TPA: hypothetical protein DCQ06_06110 [Myxococcales bacterium]|nr:hypothetical protein [Myxococcales bacterium]HAN31156.1 hypothetical protein [Myxococcales bacterium]
MRLAKIPPVSAAAIALTEDIEVIDLHLDSMIPRRIFGYDLNQRHRSGLGLFFGHLDFPRAIDSGLTGAMWSITTNPFRPASARWQAFLNNLQDLKGLVEGSENRVQLVRNHSDWVRIRNEGSHGCMVAIQGGNALQDAPQGVRSIPEDLVTRVTLVHLTNSVYGATSSPLALGRRAMPLSSVGKSLIEQLNDSRVFVDLAHIAERPFWDAVEVHDKSQPLIVTHTGVKGVKPHWRNLSDEQIRAVADTGGVVGVMLQKSFLQRAGGPKDVGMVIEHIEHIAKVAGVHSVALGTDYDGAIVPPADLRDGSAPVRIVDALLRRGWSEGDIRNVMALNFLRSFKELRP